MRSLLTTFALLILLILTAAARVSAAPVNLITNGNFSSGFAGFSSSYEERAAGLNSLWDPGTFAVDDSTDLYHELWTRNGDHTTGTGNMMFVNGETTVPDSVVLRKQLSGLLLGTQYFYEAFAANICCATFSGVEPSLDFFVNNVLLASWTLNGPGYWVGISNMWTADSTNATLEVRNGSTIFSGNDFALDDLYFGTETSLNPTPEPASMLLLGTGLLGLGNSVRRRARNRKQ